MRVLLWKSMRLLKIVFTSLLFIAVFSFIWRTFSSLSATPTWHSSSNRHVSDQAYGKAHHVWSRETLDAYGLWNYRNFSADKIKNMSNMAKRLFLNLNVGQKSDKIYLIYIHQFGKRLERRMIREFGPIKLDPFRMCSVKNCHLSYDFEDFSSADAVLFHLHLTEEPPYNLKRSNLKQIWVWLSDESPYNTLYANKNKDLSQFNGFFNWSMTYRSTSDVPVPYGRTVPLISPKNTPSDQLGEDIFTSKPKNIAVLGSNCSGRNFRQQYIQELQKFIQIDYYGGCGTIKCPGHFDEDCPLLNEYKFYLSFENTNCKEYITEKVWWNALHKKSVPVVLGSSRKDYEELLPPDSFIYVEDFQNPQKLAQYLQYLSQNETAYSTYHKWRKTFEIVNEHGYFHSPIFHYCRLCEALNYNSKESKSYDSMKEFWDPKRDCYPAKWPANS